MSQHEFWDFEGDLYRDKDYATPFRKNFKYTHAHIKTTSDFKATVRNGQYAWPGGYPMFFIMSDGEALCFDCAKKEARLIMSAIRDQSLWQSSGWRVCWTEINYEDNDLYCDHCNAKIESAYGDDDGETEGEAE